MVPEKVRQLARAHNLAILEFEAGATATSELAAKTLGVRQEQIANTLLFKGKSQHFFLIICPGGWKLNNATLRALAGERLSMATAEETLAQTGFRPGGVCAFGVEPRPELSIHIAEELGQFDNIYPAAGSDHSCLKTNYAQLKEITKAKPFRMQGRDEGEN